MKAPRRPQRCDGERRKSSLDDLAIFGGRPLFARPLHVGQPNVGDRRSLLRRIDQSLDDRRLSNDGPLVREFESRIARMVGVRECVAVTNATVGLELTIRALNLTGEAIVPAFTFIATANALQWHGIRPIFCDVAAGSFNLDPRDVEAKITPRTTAIVGVHVFGQPCPTEELAAIARRHGLALIYDAAHAFGCSHRGRMIGSFGDAEVFSFHATKFVNAFEGGAIATNRADLAKTLRLMRNFGFADYDRTECIGINGKMHEISAAMGLTSLDAMDRFVAVNQRNLEAYRAGLKDIAGIEVASCAEGETSNFQYVAVTVDASAAGLDRDCLLELLLAENVLARRYFFPGCHRMEPYRTLDPSTRLPRTEALAQRVLCLPTGENVKLRMVEDICAFIRFAVAHADADLHRRPQHPRTRAA